MLSNLISYDGKKKKREVIDLKSMKNFKKKKL
jgi:hypothetical protein